MRGLYEMAAFYDDDDVSRAMSGFPRERASPLWLSVLVFSVLIDLVYQK